LPVVAGSGGVLVAASPSGPVQLDSGRGRLLAQPGEEPADLVASQRDQLVIAWARVVSLGGGQYGQECVGEQGQDGPAVPGGPAADLMFVQGGEFLAVANPSRC
jgi:hypothetical protein